MKYPLINSRLSLVDLLNKLGTENHYSFEGKVFCPFHSNSITPAAKLFKGDNGEVLYCFAEARTYRPADVLKLLHYDLDAIESKLESKFGTYVPKENNQNNYYNNVYTDLFKKGKITIDDYCIYIKDKRS